MMENLNNVSDIISNLIMKCEKSDLSSFAYKEERFSIHFSKLLGIEDVKEPSMGDIIKYNKNDIHADLEEYSVTDNIQEDIQDSDDIVTILSPFVGTIEISNQIKLGNEEIYVNKDDVICSIEAMKIYNDIKSPVSGTVVDILIEDYSFIEYEQPILRIRVDKNE